MESKINNKFHEQQDRQRVTDLYRQHRTSTIHFNYMEQTARLSVGGNDEGILIFGSLFDILKKLARGAKTCTVAKAFERMRMTKI